MTQGLANVCCLDLVSSVPGMNLASGHITRHAHHFSTCWAHFLCGDCRLPRDMERVALWTRRRHLLGGSWSRSGTPQTPEARRRSLLSVSSGLAEGVGCRWGWGLGFCFKAAMMGLVHTKMKWANTEKKAESQKEKEKKMEREDFKWLLGSGEGRWFNNP